ncbi:HaeII restriction endonuclease, partial [Haemophilus influenzae]
MNDIQVA